ncbi:MAG TPA: type II toxin-antitoxin system RelE/ParE family toxin [Prolixibacteraceae bacterium]|nr:type II toxin-antitoxin system RelE/ParE family toxin [Prolixibacteraceae bacterium]
MREIVLSKRASNRLDKLLEYLEQEWSLKVKDDFIKKLDRSLNQIQKFPESCPKTDFVKGLHMLVITKQTSLFYRFDSKTIKVVTFFDNRMDPDELKRKLK